MGLRKWVKIILAQKPTKTDPALERGFERVFVIDLTANSLSAGEEIWKMLSRDPEAGKMKATPLFRKQESGDEVTCEELRSCLADALHRAGIYKEGLSPH